jgi:hypothetical protein
MLAQLLPWVRGRNGALLVLGSANVDEAFGFFITSLKEGKINHSFLLIFFISMKLLVSCPIIISTRHVGFL